jgi:peptidoglycan hydrolase-like protein with peptidoglycan-binding domain
MECSNIIEAELRKGDISKSLYKGSKNKALITDLQRVLFELGFRKELKWDNYQADGDYGSATKAAVSAFAKKNNHTSNGTSVSNTLAKLILQRHDFLPDMYILWSIHKSDLRTRKYISRGTPMSVTAIQVLLNELGYGKELNFPKYGADGLYGNSTKKAIIKYAKDNSISSDGDFLTRPIVNLLIKNINAYYGRYWSDLALNNLPNANSPLVYFEGSRFRGKPCRADVEFIPSLESINTYAEKANVYVYITSSFRTSSNVNGAIVKPATRSNHMAGHSIDMNVIYGNNQWANSRVLTKYPAVAEPVKKFLDSIIKDPKLRWGGEFRIKDVVHIDDGLNRNRDKWNERYQAMQRAVQLGL